MNRQKNFTFAHFNIRSLCSAFGLFSDFVLEEEYDIVGLSETWLHTGIPDSGVSIPGYDILRKDRNGRGGGVAFYYKNSLKCKILTLPPSTSHLEQIWVSVKVQGKHMCLGSLYRPPDANLSHCINDLEAAVTSFLPNYNCVLFGGDLNVDFSNNLNNGYNIASRFLTKYGLYQVINSATRVTDNSQSLLDIIVTSSRDIVKTSDVIRMDNISDHCLVNCTLKINKTRPKISFRTYRDFSEFNFDYFINDLFTIDWDYLYTLTDVNTMVNFFNKNVTAVFNIHAPVKTSRFTKSLNPWITDNIKLMIKLRKKALSKYKKAKTEAAWKEYKDLRNFVTIAIRNEKRAYLQHKFRVDPRGFWKTLKILNVNSKPSPNPAGFASSDTFNRFFIDSVPSTNITNNTFITNNYDGQIFENVREKFQFSTVTEEQIQKIVYNFKSNAKGTDEIDLKMLSLITPYLTGYMTFIINNCLTSTTVPLIWKKANVIPIPKMDTPSEITNFRPISILSTFSKILERVVGHQLKEYFMSNQILSPTQSGFRRHHSTSTTLLKVSDDLYRACDLGKNSCLLLLDYSKAFDTLDHNVLITKLKFFGLSSDSIEFLKSYLLERSQRVVLGSSISEYLPVNRGVPQGSILSPLLFSVYTSDFRKFLKSCSTHQYADDTQIYHSFLLKDMQDAAAAINEDLRIVSEYSKAHGLVLNAGKTQMLIFGKQREVLLDNLNIKIDNQYVNSSDSARNLGVIMDCQLRFDKHVSYLLQKGYGKLKILYLHKDYLPRDIKLKLCDTLILSALSYADIVFWPALFERDKESLQKLQNNCLRFSYGAQRFDHVTPLYIASRWLKLNNRFTIHFATMVHKILISGNPVYLREKLVHGYNIHQRATRHSHHLTVPRHGSVMFRRSFSYNAAKIYNMLPPLIKAKPSIPAFKTALKYFIAGTNG